MTRMKRTGWLRVLLTSLVVAMAGCAPPDPDDSQDCDNYDDAPDVTFGIMLNGHVAAQNLEPLEGATVTFRTVKVPCGMEYDEAVGTTRELFQQGKTNAAGDFVSSYPHRYSIRNYRDDIYLEMTAEYVSPANDNAFGSAQTTISHYQGLHAPQGVYTWSPAVSLYLPVRQF